MPIVVAVVKYYTTPFTFKQLISESDEPLNSLLLQSFSPDST